MNKILFLILIFVSVTSVRIQPNTSRVEKKIQELERLEETTSSRIQQLEKDYSDLFVETELVLEELEQSTDTLEIPEKKRLIKRVIESVKSKKDTLEINSQENEY